VTTLVPETITNDDDTRREFTLNDWDEGMNEIWYVWTCLINTA